MNNLWDYLFDFAQAAWNYICEIFETIILEIIVSFLDDVINYFKAMLLESGIQIPFIMSTEESVNNPFADLIADDLKGDGIIEGVYNKETDKVESLRYVGGNGMDEQLKELTKRKPITIFN